MADEDCERYAEEASRSAELMAAALSGISTEKQFDVLMKKLEEIRCGIIDVEVLLEKLVKQNGETV